MSGRAKAAARKNGKAPHEAAPLAIEYVAPDALTPAAYNPRTMPEAARRKLERSVKEFGLVDPIVARRSDRLVIGGHQRLDVAKALGLTSVPVVFLDGVDDRRAAALNVALNNPDVAGEWDFAKLTDLLSTLDAESFDATLTGFDVERLEELLTWTPDVPRGPAAAAVDPAAEWDGMPEFTHGDERPYRSLRVHFRNEEDVQDFARRLGQQFSPEARWIWHPKLKMADFMAQRYAGAAGEP